AWEPMAVFSVPVVRLKSASSPSAVLPPRYPPSGGGRTARPGGESAKQTSVRDTSRKTRHRHERLTKFRSAMVLTLSGSFRAYILNFLSSPGDYSWFSSLEKSEGTTGRKDPGARFNLPKINKL